MAETYPIVAEQSLDPAARGGPFGLGRQRRTWGDLPRAKADQVLVYLANGRHIVDSGRRALDDEAVVHATHVSVVDLSRNREVAVELGIPSLDAKEFTVRVMFLCHVTDPVAVVRDGQGDATRVLLGYVRSHQKLVQLGLNHKISQVNEIRLRVQTQIQAYAHYVPPDIPGMTVSLSNVEVLTPGEWATHSGRLTQEEFDDELTRVREHHARTQEMLKNRYELQLDEQAHMLRRQRQQGDHELAATDNRFAAREMAELDEAVGGDPLRAALIAYQKGELTAAAYAALVQTDQDRREAAERADQERRHELAAADLAWRRERDARRETWDREDRVRVFAQRMDVYKELAKHGHLDEMGMEQIERSMDRIVGPLGGRPGGTDRRIEPHEEEPRAALGEGDDPDIPDELREENSG